MSFPTPHFSALGPQAAAPRPKPRPTAEVTTRCKTIIPPLASRSLDTSNSQQHQRDATSSSSGSVQPPSYQQHHQQTASRPDMAASSSSRASTGRANQPVSASASGSSQHEAIILSPDLTSARLPTVGQPKEGSSTGFAIPRSNQSSFQDSTSNGRGSSSDATHLRAAQPHARGTSVDRTSTSAQQPQSSFAAQPQSKNPMSPSSFTSALHSQALGGRGLDHTAGSSSSFLTPRPRHAIDSHAIDGLAARGSAEPWPSSTVGRGSSARNPALVSTAITPGLSTTLPTNRAGQPYWNSSDDSILLAAVRRSGSDWFNVHKIFNSSSSIPRTSVALSHRLLKLFRQGKTKVQPSDLGPVNPAAGAGGSTRTPVKVVRCDAWSEEETDIVRRGLAEAEDWATICETYEKTFGTKKRSREAIRKRMRNMSKASEACREDQGDGDEDAAQSISHGTSAYNHSGPASSRSAPAHLTVSPSRSSSSSPFGSHDEGNFSPSIKNEDEEGEDYLDANDAQASSRAWSVWSKHDDQLLLDSIAPYRKGRVKWAEVVDRFNKSCDKQRIQKTLQNRAGYLKTMQQQALASAGTGLASTSTFTPSSRKRERTAPKVRWLDAEIKVLRDSLARHHKDVPYSYCGVYTDFFRAFPRSNRSRSAVRHRCVQLAGLAGARRGGEDGESEDEGEWDRQGYAEEESDEYEDVEMGGLRKRARREQGSHGGKPYKPAKSQRQGRQDEAYEAESSYLDDSFNYSHSQAVPLGTASAQPPTFVNSSTWSQQQPSPPHAPYSSSRIQELAVGVTYEAAGVRIEGCIPGLEVMVLSPTCVKLLTTQEESVEPFEEQPAFRLRCHEDGAVQAVVLPRDTTMSTSIIERQQGARKGWGVQTTICAVDGFRVVLIS